MTRKLLAAAAAIVALSAVSVTPADARYQRVGTLECRVAPNVSFIIGSVKYMNCVFRSSRGGRPHRYTARNSRIGLDLNISAGGVFAWAVFAENERLYHGDLRGRYAGASGNIALGLGIGGNALVGGSRNTVALQPLSIEGQVGVGLALGVTELVLR